MKLSIIIPYHNNAENIEKLLDSILSECNDAEIIVVDDNSTKGIETYENTVTKYRERVLFCNNDSGVAGAGAARNVGLSRATGEWLLFADSDDYFLKGWYDAVSDYFGSKYDIVFFSPTSADYKTGKVGNRHEMYAKEVAAYIDTDGNTDAERHLRWVFIVPWSKLIRRSIVSANKIKFDEVMYANDVMFSVKTAFFADKIAADRREIYCVTENDSSLTTDESEKAWGIRHEVFCKKNLFLREHLNKEDYRFIKLTMGSYERLRTARKRKCGLKNLLKYCHMYRIYKVPVMCSAVHWLKCRIALRLRAK